MPSRIWFVKNITHEGAGLWAPLAEAAGIDSRIIDYHQGESLPAIDSKDAVVVLGGPDSANDATAKIRKEHRFLRTCLDRKIPLLGICLGLQLLIKAQGGTVLKNPVKEIGFRDPEGDWFQMKLTSDGMEDPLLKGLSPVSRVFQLHGETVELTAGMTRLAEGAFCKNQIVKIQEKAYGIQGHVELDEQMFQDWLVKDADLRQMDVASLRQEFNEVRLELERNARVIFSNFLKLAGLN